MRNLYSVSAVIIELRIFAYRIARINKEVFVKHEQAPTAPKLEGLWVFVDFGYIISMKTAILAHLTTSGGVFLTEMVKRHIYRPIPFI